MSIQTETFFENCVLLGYRAASNGNLFPTFRGNLSISSSRVKNLKIGLLTPEERLESWSLKTGPKGCPETSVRNYHYWLRNNPEERSYHLLGGRSLKSSRVIFRPVLDFPDKRTVPQIRPTPA